MFRIVDDWYILCRSNQVSSKPFRTALFGTPLVIFRDGKGEVGVLLDRCPHRNAPLSLGSLRGDNLQCAYHGWQFDTKGECRFAAGIAADRITKACHATAYPVREQQGFVWVYASSGSIPEREPYVFPMYDDQRYTTVSRELHAEASVLAVAENALDVPHTAYLHGGLFRTSTLERREIEVILKHNSGFVQAEYLGERRPTGLAAWLLAPGGGEVTHFDRFVLPSICQVEYRLGEKTHMLVTSALTPVDEDQTTLHVVLTFRLPIPGWIAVPILRPLFLKIFLQDAAMLRHQTGNIRRFGGEQFASIEADLLGPHIRRLLKLAESGERVGSREEVQRKRIWI